MAWCTTNAPGVANTATLLPVADAAYDVGAAASRYRNAYFSGTVSGAVTASTLTATATSNQLNLGDTTAKYDIINAVAPALTQTLSIPDTGSATASFLMSKGNQSMAGVQTVSNATASSSVATGAVVVAGGVGVGGSVFAGGVVALPATAGTV